MRAFAEVEASAWQWSLEEKGNREQETGTIPPPCIVQCVCVGRVVSTRRKGNGEPLHIAYAWAGLSQPGEREIMNLKIDRENTDA